MMHRAVAGLAWIALLSATAPPPASAQAVVADLPIPSGGTERVAFLPASAPRATVILLAGGEGVVQIGPGGEASSNNFLIRTRQLWAPYGINAVIVGAPDNRSLLGQRSQPAYAAALGVAVDFARLRSNVPVWLVGTSQGSIAAVNGAARLGGKVAGVVLTSSVTQQSRSGETAFGAGANAVALPALVVSNSRDSCRASPPSDAQALLAAMAGSPRKEVMLFDSSAIQSDPCEALSPHGYLGIEPSVIQRIAGWINAAPGR
jgi:pimeloyl-ACP methyl ester carboxylesterase